LAGSGDNIRFILRPSCPEAKDITGDDASGRGSEEDSKTRGKAGRKEGENLETERWEGVILPDI